MNSRTRHSSKPSQQSKHNSFTGFNNIAGLPANKRPRVGDSPQISNSSAHWKHSSSSASSTHNNKVNTAFHQTLTIDPFGDDDIFTGEELAELELVASQAEGGTSKQSNQHTATNDVTHQMNQRSMSGSVAFKAPQPPLSRKIHTSLSSADGNSCSGSSKQVIKLKQQCIEYETKVKELEKKFNQKLGETSILRDKLENAERLLLDERRTKAMEKLKIREEKSQRESELAKKVEAFQDQIEFKQVELKEAESQIRNLEIKNKALSEEMKMCCVPKESVLSSQRLSQSDEGAHKKIKFVKPESPRIPISKQKLSKDFSRNVTTSSPSSSQEKKAGSHKSKRKVFRLLTTCAKESPEFPYGSPFHSSAFYQLLTDCKLARASCTSKVRQQLLIDCIDGVENFRDTEHTKHIFQLVQMCLRENLSAGGNFRLCALCGKGTYRQVQLKKSYHISGDNSVYKSDVYDSVSQPVGRRVLTGGPRDVAEQKISTNETLLEVTKTLLVHNPSFAAVILNQFEDFLSFTMSYSKRCDKSEAILTVLSVLTMLVKNASPGQLAKFSMMASESRRFFNRTESRLPIVDLIHSVVSSDDIAECVAAPSEANELSFLSMLCATSRTEAEKSQCSFKFLFKAVSFFSELVCTHKTILTKHGCFAEVYHTLNVLLYHQLIFWEQEKVENIKSTARLSLISQCTCLLHSCSNTFADGIPGVHRDHKHLLVLWKLQRFVDAQMCDDSLWYQELKKILQREIDSLENCD